MKTEITNVIPYTNLENNCPSKLYLMDFILEHFTFSLQNSFEEKKKVYDDLKQDLQKLTEKSKSNLESLKDINQKLEKEKIRRRFFSLILNYIKYDIFYGSYKNMILDLFKNFEVLSNETIKEKIKKLENVYQKNINQLKI